MSLFQARLRSSREAENGFTLIELLIVIVILGILAGIAIFGVSAFQGQATSACNKANSRINATVSAANLISSSSSYIASGGTCQ